MFFNEKNRMIWTFFDKENSLWKLNFALFFAHFDHFVNVQFGTYQKNI